MQCPYAGGDTRTTVFEFPTRNIGGVPSTVLLLPPTDTRALIRGGVFMAEAHAPPVASYLSEGSFFSSPINRERSVADEWELQPASASAFNSYTRNRPSSSSAWYRRTPLDIWRIPRIGIYYHSPGRTNRQSTLTKSLSADQWSLMSHTQTPTQSPTAPYLNNTPTCCEGEIRNRLRGNNRESRVTDKDDFIDLFNFTRG